MPTKLTANVKAGGCASKLSPKILDRALKTVPRLASDKILVGYDIADAAGVYDLTQGGGKPLAIVRPSFGGRHLRRFIWVHSVKVRSVKDTLNPYSIPSARQLFGYSVTGYSVTGYSVTGYSFGDDRLFGDRHRNSRFNLDQCGAQPGTAPLTAH